MRLAYWKKTPEGYHDLLFVVNEANHVPSKEDYVNFDGKGYKVKSVAFGYDRIGVVSNVGTIRQVDIFIDDFDTDSL